MGITDLRSFTIYNNDKAIWRRMKNNNIVPICWMMKKFHQKFHFLRFTNNRGYTITEIKCSAWLLMNAFLKRNTKIQIRKFLNISFDTVQTLQNIKRCYTFKMLKISILYFDLYCPELDFLKGYNPAHRF